MRHQFTAICALAVLAACGGGGGGGTPPANPTSTPTSTPTAAPTQPQYYQPLASGDSWTYDCHNTQNLSEPHYTIQNTILGTATVAGQSVYEFSMQIPSSPTQSTTIVELLANDGQQNTSIYGYLVNGTPAAIAPTVIVAASPGPKGTAYNYTAQNGSSIDRIFEGVESSNPTQLGTFTVAPYFESGGTHNYGYALGTGIVEEDHGPNYLYDCLITAATLH